MRVKVRVKEMRAQRGESERVNVRVKEMRERESVRQSEREPLVVRVIL